MTDRATWELAGAQQGHVALEAAWRYAKPLLLAGHRMQLVIEEAPKSRDQEKKYHAMIGDIAAQVSLIPGREHEKPEDAKRLLISAFREDTKDDADLMPYWRAFGRFNLAPGLRGELVALGIPSRKFKRPLAAAFITWLGAFGDERGVVWTEPGDE